MIPSPAPTSEGAFPHPTRPYRTVPYRTVRARERRGRRGKWFGGFGPMSCLFAPRHAPRQHDCNCRRKSRVCGGNISSRAGVCGGTPGGSYVVCPRQPERGNLRSGYFCLQTSVVTVQHSTVAESTPGAIFLPPPRAAYVHSGARGLRCAPVVCPSVRPSVHPAAHLHYPPSIHPSIRPSATYPHREPARWSGGNMCSGHSARTQRRLAAHADAAAAPRARAACLSRRRNQSRARREREAQSPYCAMGCARTRDWPPSADWLHSLESIARFFLFVSSF